MIISEYPNTQGNDVKQRAHVMAEDGQRTWLNPTKLHAGTLTKFFMYVGYVNESSTAQIRLQIWRPVNNSDSVTHLLVWEIRVAVALNNPNGALYVVNIIHVCLCELEMSQLE